MTPDDLFTWRKARGLTQKQLAERLGVNKQTVARWEWGMWPITLRTELQIKGLERELTK